MKNIFLTLVISLAFLSCSSQVEAMGKGASGLHKIRPDARRSTKYELIVMDPGYELFLATQPPKWFHTNDYYRTWNIQYVTEWNYRHENPAIYGDFYETRIDYDPGIHYGLDLNYRLYQYFQFIAQKYGIVLISRRGETIASGK